MNIYTYMHIHICIYTHMAKNIFLASYIGLRKENISVLSDHHSNNICRKLSNIHVSYLHTIPQISKACKKASDFCFTHGGSPAQRSWVTCLRPFSLWLAEFELFGGTRKHSANTEKYWKATSGMWASMTFSAQVLDTARPERWRWDVQGPFFERDRLRSASSRFPCGIAPGAAQHFAG